MSHLRDENIPSVFDDEGLVLKAEDICAFVQHEALVKRSKLFSFNDIYSVFVAETKYLEEVGLIF